MAILQISQVQVRRGLNQDLPQLAGGELGWSQDTRQLYIGNGTLAEGAPALGQTEILTQFSILNFTNTLTANVVALQSNVAILQGNVVTMQAAIAALQAGTLTANTITVTSGAGTITNLSANNAIISYTLNQGTTQRTGQLKYSFNNSAVNYDEEYTEPSATPTNISLSMTVANSSYVSLNYSTTSTTSIQYQVSSLV
jgi:hypothetical protein